MIGAEVRRRREKLGLTGAQLAARAGLAASAVSQIETGKRVPSSMSVMKLANALGIEAGDLFPKGQDQLPLERPPVYISLASGAAGGAGAKLASIKEIFDTLVVDLNDLHDEDAVIARIAEANRTYEKVMST